MRLTVAVKIATGFGLVLLVGIASMTIIYRGLDSVRAAMDRLALRTEPASAAAYEMEIQLHGLVADVLGYSETADPRAREEMGAHDAKFEKFRSLYVTLTETSEESELGRAIGRHYDELKALGKVLIAKKDEQEALNAVIAENFARIDEIVDGHLQPRATQPSGMIESLRHLLVSRRKIEAVLDVEADTAEVGLWLANYQRLRKPEYRERIFQHAQEVQAGLKKLKALDLTAQERQWAVAVEGLFNRTMSLIGQMLALDAETREGVTAFVKRAAAMDRLLDDEIQVLARQQLLAPTQEAEQATSAVIGGIRLLIPLFVLSAVAIAFLLVRVITRPVKALTAGTHAVARGQLTHRVQPMGRDELADLATEFNRMVAELEATTVSKRQLEVSDEKLKLTVSRLREEINERTRAEQEQARLQVSLRRAATMAAMGSLVAGVAHEVRNPLFGITSVLDAMEARLGSREEFRQYMDVLREPVARLTGLMQELLEYGRPPSVHLTPSSIVDLIEEAVRSCQPLADELLVRIRMNAEVGDEQVSMERMRLARAFENILRNALQHSPPGTQITANVRAIAGNGGRWVHCAISDAGPGIPAEDLPRIFEPFFTRRRGGTGLGLSIVQRIVEEHGGHVTAHNRPEGGAVLTVSLPVVGVAGPA
jgi:signal transduction histidine kinase